jgi:hypothetical protein
MKKKLIFVLLSVYIFFSLTFLAEFRKIRDSFPPVIIDSENIVGFVQFYNYPPLFDLIFFCVLVSTPISILFFVFLLLKKWKK